MSQSRAQTTLDFAIGISVFLIVLIFVFSFVPGLLEPFAASDKEAPALSNRIADRLAMETLGDPEEPYVLDTACADDFFSGSGCGYNGGDLAQDLSAGDGTSVNVTLVGDIDGDGTNTILCWDGSSLSEGSCGGTVLTAGDAPPTANDATVTARRVVSFDSEDVTLKVVVW